MAMGCLYLEIEGQSCLLDNVDQGFMKHRQIDLSDRMTIERVRNKYFYRFSPIATLPGIFQPATCPFGRDKLYDNTNLQPTCSSRDDTAVTR